MITTIKFTTIIGWLPPFLIVVLSIISGFTTYHGLSFFTVKLDTWMTVALAVSIQVVIVMSTLQFALAYWSASPWRLISALCCLLFSASVSIFFSYFTFYEFSEAPDILMQQKFKIQKEHIETFVSNINNVRSHQILLQKQKVEVAKKNEELAFGGKLPDGSSIPLGPGKHTKFFNEKAADEKKTLDLLQNNNNDIILAADAASFIVKLGVEGLSNKQNYENLLAKISSASKASNEFSALVGEQPVPTPNLIGFQEYVQVIPSLQSLDKISWLPLFLAILVDFLTFILSYWLEHYSFGSIKKIDRDRLVEQLLSFNQWGINNRNQFELRLPKTESERAANTHDADRLFVASMFLNKGYLRRVNRTQAEFTPAMYDLMNESFRDKESNR